MSPSPEWQVLLEGFRPLFTKPGYRYFCAFVLVFAHLDRRLWVTQVILAGLVERHFTSFYRFLRRAAGPSPPFASTSGSSAKSAARTEPAAALSAWTIPFVARRAGSSPGWAGITTR
jgi:hypothetical protein